MQRKSLIAALSIALAAGAFTAGARAQSEADDSFSGTVKISRMDRNKDGMVSRAEFLEMTGEVYDMKAKEMGV